MHRGVCILDASRQTACDWDGVLARLTRVFGLPARRTERPLDLDRVFDAARRQHNAAALLPQVAACAADPVEKVVALVDVDLFVPVLSFVFGQAQLDGPAAVVSTRRLAPEFYGLPPARALLGARIEKELVHELGHQFGLVHCRQFECVMRALTAVEAIDLKRATPCPACDAAMRARLAAV